MPTSGSGRRRRARAAKPARMPGCLRQTRSAQAGRTIRRGTRRTSLEDCNGEEDPDGVRRTRRVRGDAASRDRRVHDRPGRLLRARREGRQLLVPLGGGHRLRARLHRVRPPQVDRTVTMQYVGLLVLAVTLGACRSSLSSTSAQAPAEPAEKRVVARFGPVLGAEVIGGRADDGDQVLVLAGGVDLVRVDLASRRVTRTKLGVTQGEECWSLARLSEGSLWTLRGRRTLARIAPDGSIAHEEALAEPHVGLFGVGERLVFQRADFTPPAPALLAGAPAGARSAWSTIETRVFPTLARASVAALNMITCGATRAAERACWFPDEAALFMVSGEGITRRVALDGLDVVGPETLLTSDNPARPVRDAYVDAAGAIWVLSSGKAPPGAADVPGGWILARYGSSGTLERRARLSEAVRLILQADARAVVVLASNGTVAEIPRW